jgi:hypothetical protein
MTVYQNFEFTCVASMSAREETDRGPGGSVIETSFQDLRLTGIEICGKDYTQAELIEVFGLQGAAAIIRICEENLSDDDWSE